MTAIIDPTSIFTVAVRVNGAAASVQLAAIAAVPRRFRLADGPVADVVVVEPSNAAWLELVDGAVRDGARGVMVAGRTTGPPEVARLVLERAVAAGVAVVLCTAYAATVVWQSVVAEVAADAARAGVLDSVVTWPVGDADQAGASRRALLDQLAVVRPLIEHGSGLRTIHSGAGGYEVVGDGQPITTLTGVRAPVRDARLDLDLVSAGPHWRVRFDTGAAARPVVIQRMDSGGVRELPLRFESGARACWVALHEQLTGLAPVAVDEGFLADLEVADRLLPLA